MPELWVNMEMWDGRDADLIERFYSERSVLERLVSHVLDNGWTITRVEYGLIELQSSRRSDHKRKFIRLAAN